jgi:hypothetical protein
MRRVILHSVGKFDRRLALLFATTTPAGKKLLTERWQKLVRDFSKGDFSTASPHNQMDGSQCIPVIDDHVVVFLVETRPDESLDLVDHVTLLTIEEEPEQMHKFS